MRWIVFLVISSFLFGATAWAKPSNALEKEFKKAVGLKETEYALKQGSKDCFEGDLEIFPVKDYLSITVGGQLLVSEFGLTKKTNTYSEQGCEIQESSERKGRVLASTQTRTCGANKDVRVRNIDFKKTGAISYSITFTKQGAAPVSVQCELEAK